MPSSWPGRDRDELAMATGIQITRKDFSKLDAILRQSPQQVEDFLDMAAEEIVGDIVLSFGTSPSDPGDPPGVDTGALRASMEWSRENSRTRVIHDGVEYGVYLEEGTSVIAPRPFVGPVFEEWRQRRLAAFARDFGLLS